MPIEYVGAGVLAEYAAVRERVGIFDVSHMGTLVVSGPQAAEALGAVLTNAVADVAPGSAQYELLCDANGGVVDDLIIYVREREIVLVPNAENVDAVVAALRAGLAATQASVADLSSGTAILAIQGPRSPEVLESVGLDANLEYMHFADCSGPAGESVLAARTGYTGERGYELMIPVDAAHDWWERLHAAVVAEGGMATGLGARDILRTEMGYPLYGHELSPEISPLQAGLGWAIAWRKPQFLGKGALVAEREAGPRRRLRALLCMGRGIPRAGMGVHTKLGDGEVTSGTFSPGLRAGIALALLPASVDVGDEVVIDIRGRECLAQVVRAPFVKADPRR